MKRILFVLAGLLIITSFMACSKEPEKRLTAIDYVNAFVEAGLPVEKIIEYDENTDPNKLLGRPGNYISKVNFADSRIEQFDDTNPLGGTVEVFKSKKDLEARKKYIESLQEASPLFGGQYIYVSADGLALLRLEYDLTPEQAQEYVEIFQNPDIIASSNSVSSDKEVFSQKETEKLETTTLQPVIQDEPKIENNKVSNGKFQFSADDYFSLLQTDNEYAALKYLTAFTVDDLTGKVFSSSSIKLINYSDQSQNTILITLICKNAYLNSSHYDVFIGYLKQVLNYCNVKSDKIDFAINASKEKGNTAKIEDNGVSIQFLWGEENIMYKIYPSDTSYDVLGLPIEGRGDILFDKEAREVISSYNEKYQYAEMLDYINLYISENSPADDDNVYTIKSLAESSKELLSKCRIEKDEVADEYIIYYKGIDSITSKTNIVPLIEGNSLSVWLGFHASDWIFFEDVEIKIDGAENITMSFNYFDIDRTVKRGVTEKIKTFFPFDSDTLALLLETEKPIIRFIGDHDNKRDHEITSTEIEAITTMFYIRENYDTISNMVYRFE